MTNWFIDRLLHLFQHNFLIQKFLEKFPTLMLLGDLNLLFFFFFILIFSILVNTNTSLHLLLTAELLWITLYAIVLFIGLAFDNPNILSLTFFFLVFSAVEFGLGLILLLLQNILTRSASLIDLDTNFLKFANRFKNKLYVNRIYWKN